MSDDARLLHHEYDGIQEYDNPLPFWWSGIFVLCTVYSAVYVYWYHAGGPGKSILRGLAKGKDRARPPRSVVFAPGRFLGEQPAVDRRR